jgi:thioredoxin 1
MVAPVMEKVSQKYDGKCSFYKMNVDENPKTAAKFRVMSLPTLMFFKNGEAVNTVVGAVGERAFTPKVDEIL